MWEADGRAEGLDLERIRDEIVLATLPNVIFDGWSHRALREGAEAAGYDPGMALRAFPDGVAEAVAHFSAWADRQMLAELERHDLAVLRVRERIALAIRIRLDALAPHKEAVRLALSFLALPQHVVLAGRLVYRTVDAIWYAAGDTATDFNYYTKRGLLAGVYSATVLYWLNDTSEAHRDTWDFLERRIGDVMRLGRSASRAGDLGAVLARLPSPFRFARQVRRRLSGA